MNGNMIRIARLQWHCHWQVKSGLANLQLWLGLVCFSAQSNVIDNAIDNINWWYWWGLHASAARWRHTIRSHAFLAQSTSKILSGGTAGNASVNDNVIDVIDSSAMNFACQGHEKDPRNQITCHPGPEHYLDPVRESWWEVNDIITFFADRIMSKPRTNGADIFEILGRQIHWETEKSFIWGNAMPASWRRGIHQRLLDNHYNISPELQELLVGEVAKDNSTAAAAADQEESYVNHANDHVTPLARMGSNLSVTLPASSKSVVNYVCQHRQGMFRPVSFTMTLTAKVSVLGDDSLTHVLTAICACQRACSSI